MKRIAFSGLILLIFSVSLSSTNFIDWRIKIGVKTDKYRDSYNYIGVSKISSLFYDEKDIPEPPAPPTGLCLYFPHFDWALNPGRYATDFRPPIVNAEYYEFVVEAGEINEITLFWSDMVVDAPKKYTFTLIDKERGILVNMREFTQYALGCNSGDKINFMILVKKNERIRDGKPVIKK